MVAGGHLDLTLLCFYFTFPFLLVELDELLPQFNRLFLFIVPVPILLLLVALVDLGGVLIELLHFFLSLLVQLLMIGDNFASGTVNHLLVLLPLLHICFFFALVESVLIFCSQD